VRIYLLGLLLTLGAQETTFRATVPVVQVPVTVTDAQGKLVDGLEAADFAVTDKGRAVRFQMDTADAVDVPLALVVLVQTNDLSAAALLKIQKAGSMIQPLLTGERGAAAVLAVDETVTLVQEFTGDGEEIRRAFGRLQPRRARRTVALDGVARAVEMLRARPGNARRVVLLIGEAKDRGSEAELESVLEQLQRENVQLFAATYSVTRTQWTTRASDRPKASGGENDIVAGLAELVRLGKANTAEALAQHTGGRRLEFATLRGLEGIVTRFGEQLHGQYLLSFPASGPEGFHAVTVTLREPGRRAVASRQGYWAGAAQ
jgi:VWFA-related protein